MGWRCDFIKLIEIIVREVPPSPTHEGSCRLHNIESDECNRLHDVFYDNLVLFSRVLVTFGGGCPLCRLHTLRGEWVIHGIAVRVSVSSNQRARGTPFLSTIVDPCDQPQEFSTSANGTLLGHYLNTENKRRSTPTHLLLCWDSDTAITVATYDVTTDLVY